MENSQKTKQQLLREAAKRRPMAEPATYGREPEAGHRRDRYDILDGLYDGYYEVDLNGNYTFVNQAICEFLGYSAEELLGRDGKNFIPPYSRLKVLTLYKKVFKTGVPGRMTDYEFIHKNGEVRHIDLSAALIRNEQGHPMGFRGIARDRTEEHRRELELERYRDFVESIEDACFEADLEGNFTFANAGMCLIHGYPYEELIGMNYRQFTSPEESKSVFQVFNSIYRTGIPAKIVDYSITQKNGAVRNLEVSASLIRDTEGSPIGFRGISRDRTEKKAKERELERYQSFVEGVEDGCFEVDLKGNITFCNDAACRIFGYRAEQLMGMNNRSYSSPETAKRVYRIFNQIYRTGHSGEIRDYDIRGGDGKLRYLHLAATLIRDGSGTPIGFRGICRDTTGQKLTEAENERLIALLNEAQRLEAIATLAAGVAHNFNNLLMSIQGFVSLMFLDIHEGHRHFNRLKTIEDLIKRGSDLTTQLLGYARHGHYATRPIDVKGILQSAIARFKATQPEIGVYPKLPDALWSVPADSEQIESVLRNIFVNAGEAMPAGGTLHIEAENILLKESFVAPYDLTPGPFVKISVIDTGVGMDPATKERIFEPFFSTKDVSKGAGLGLASAYGAVKSHGGIILVDSEKGKGTTFAIYLPAMSKDIQEGVPAVASASDLSRTILLVDDEKVICEVVGDIITQMGYQIITACNGEEALEIFSANQEKIDLAIIDMVMPDMSGFPFAPGRRQTGAMRDPRQAFLQKPLQPGSLSTTIRQLIEV